MSDESLAVQKEQHKERKTKKHIQRQIESDEWDKQLKDFYERMPAMDKGTR